MANQWIISIMNNGINGNNNNGIEMWRIINQSNVESINIESENNEIINNNQWNNGINNESENNNQ
jgi:hypothetical protein